MACTVKNELIAALCSKNGQNPDLTSCQQVLQDACIRFPVKVLYLLAM